MFTHRLAPNHVATGDDNFATSAHDSVQKRQVITAVRTLARRARRSSNNYDTSAAATTTNHGRAFTSDYGRWCWRLPLRNSLRTNARKHLPCWSTSWTEVL